MGDLDYWLSISPFELSENDRKSLVTKHDEDWRPQTWAELKSVILNHDDLSVPTRWPTDMRNYLMWRREMQQKWPDISAYVATQRLGWPAPIEGGFPVRNSRPFADPADYCIRRNDWPWAVERDVGHMVVWSKIPIDVDDQGDPAPGARQVVEDFVETIFRRRLNANGSISGGEIIWFKNRTRWQSVKTLEHIHVLTKGVDDKLIEEWTGQTASETISGMLSLSN